MGSIADRGMASVLLTKSGRDATPRQYLTPLVDAYLASGVLHSVRNRAYSGRGYLPGHMIGQGFSYADLVGIVSEGGQTTVGLVPSSQLRTVLPNVPAEVPADLRQINFATGSIFIGK